MTRLAIAFAALCLLAAPAFAHAAGRGFVMLLPTGWVIAGGALAVLVSFAAVSLLPRLAMKAPVLPAPLSPVVAQVMSLLSALVLAALIVLGCVLLVSFGNHQSDLLTAAELMENYRK